ncbi:hypothetical protein ACWOFR_17775 [Carnobacterium gallinarum]|uniref:hypothetical protein n=1 Tax=Carnobacterium gallinarum TaxID=2749 RepID=UPI00055604E8|nr:hypothetical protein [Carnobacterium gallinarum]
MEVIGLILIVSGISIMCMVLYRLFIQKQIQNITISEDSSKEFLKKLEIVKRNELSKHVIAIFIISIALSMMLILITSRLYKFNYKIDYLSSQNSNLKDNLEILRKQQTKIIDQIELTPYPEKGLQIKTLEWRDLFINQEKKAQHSLEMQLSQKLAPYVGLNNILAVVNTHSATLDLTIEGNAIDKNNEAIKENIDLFVVEISEISELSQINLKLNDTKSDSHQTVYSCSYTRNDKDEDFKRTSMEN